MKLGTNHLWGRSFKIGWYEWNMKELWRNMVPYAWAVGLLKISGPPRGSSGSVTSSVEVTISRFRDRENTCNMSKWSLWGNKSGRSVLVWFWGSWPSNWHKRIHVCTSIPKGCHTAAAKIADNPNCGQRIAATLRSSCGQVGHRIAAKGLFCHEITDRKFLPRVKYYVAYSFEETLWGKHKKILGKYEKNIKEYVENMKKYEGNMTKYVENMKNTKKIGRNMKKYVENMKIAFIFSSLYRRLDLKQFRSLPYYIGAETWKNSDLSPST